MKIETAGSVMIEDERFAIEDDCRRLICLAAQHVDFGRANDFADLFMANGRLTIAGTTSEGSEAIRARIAARPGDQVSRHFCASIAIDVQSPNEARGTSYVCLFRGRRATPLSALPMEMPFLVGHFVDRFVRTPLGWRIAERTLNSDFRRASFGRTCRGPIEERSRSGRNVDPADASGGLRGNGGRGWDRTSDPYDVKEPPASAIQEKSKT